MNITVDDHPIAFANFIRLSRAELPPPLAATFVPYLASLTNHCDLPLEALTKAQRIRMDEAWGNPVTEKELETCSRRGIFVTWTTNEERPHLVRNAPLMPAFVFARGDLRAASRRCIAIVGTRNASAYAERQTQVFAKYLVERGVVIVSGGAAGIDTFSHKAAIDARVATIAVMGTGLLRDFPVNNAGLFDDIVDCGGLLISEYAPISQGKAWKFPERNRIIAALSQLTLVAEAGIKSGALITASFAGTFGRDICVIPGPLDDGNNEGGHELIRDGATLVVHPRQMLPESPGLFDTGYISEQRIVQARMALTESEQRLMQLIPIEGIHPSVLGELSTLPLAETNALLTILELKGAIARTTQGTLRPV
jgi:DNA processing protein